ncbi:MAG TPA: glycosyltransferase family 2 protein [Elusimicrobiales bacterium]|nr:glycosyltransferase family 2 protein [Elusimicrobiales bacterium]
MALVVLTLKAYVIVVIALTCAYLLRQFIFSISRLVWVQKVSYQDIIDSDLPSVTVLVPMHNEERVASNILDRMLETEYPRDRLEVIPINDHSEDDTRHILDIYAKRYPFIKPLNRDTGRRGKPAAINDALRRSSGEVIIVFDADYMPPKGIIRDIAVAFKDPEIGAVMGRVIPENAGVNLLTRLLDLERSGGYQVDQQARYNLGLMPQYGGTVGGFRRAYCVPKGGECFNPNILTEDTELTVKLFISGRKVAYANRVECYEEVPEDWTVRGRQIRRWARGHSQVMFKYMLPLLRASKLSWKEKLDGALLLFIYAMPPLFLGSVASLTALFFIGEPAYAVALPFFFATVAFNSFGNFSTFFQIGTAVFLDGSTYRVRLLPFIILDVFFNAVYISDGFLDALLDQLAGRKTEWQKTLRYRRTP